MAATLNSPSSSPSGSAASPVGHLHGISSDNVLHRAAPHAQSPPETVENGLVYSTLTALALVLGWYCFSTILSLFNKEMMGKKYGFLDGTPFPAPILMCSAQFALQHLFARIAHAAGIPRTAPTGEKSDWALYSRTVLPNGIATGLDIAFSNASFAFITLSFYTMCKSSSPLFLLIFAFMWGLERPTWSLAGIVLVISSGLLILVAGETEFNLAGFILVMSAACLAGLRWTITQLLLQGGDTGGGVKAHKKSVLEVVEELTPVMAIVTGVASLAFENLWHVIGTNIYFESLENLMITLSLVFASAVLAFFMVWIEFALISYTSALTFMVAGVFKEIVTVLVAHFTLGDHFSTLNGVGLCVLIVGVGLFNWNKYARLKEAEAAAILRGSPRFSTTRLPESKSSKELEMSTHVSDADDGERVLLLQTSDSSMWPEGAEKRPPRTSPKTNGSDAMTPPASGTCKVSRHSVKVDLT